MVSEPAPQPPFGRARLRAAWLVAIGVDALQLATAPAEAGGPVVWLLEGGVDLAAMAALWALVGFHWAFLPSFVTKLLPIVDLAPTWTVAVFIATRGRGHGPSTPLKELP